MGLVVAVFFSNKPLYSMKDNISVGVCSNKRNNFELRQNINDSKSEDMEILFSEVITQGIDALILVIPGIIYISYHQY